MVEFNPGDKIKITTRVQEYVGILMPRPKLADDEHIILKLGNGYNIGILKSEIISAVLVGKYVKPMKSRQKNKAASVGPKVSILSTGGTISSKIDYQTGGVNASYTADDLLDAAPELADIAQIDCRSIMNVMSEDMTPALWVKMAEEAVKELGKHDGVVLTHGTDTMHYSSAALSFFIRDLGKPVVFTGSQRSSDRGSSDSFMNLVCSTIFAKSDYAGVSLVMHGSINDNFCLAHQGTRVRKMHTSRRDAFKSINNMPLAKVYSNGKIDILTERYASRSGSKPTLDTKIDEKVGFIKVYPGMDPKIVEFYVDNGYHGIVFEGTALGHVPTTVADKSLIPSIEYARENNVLMIMVTQCLYGRVHPLVYANLREVSSRGVIYCGDMLPETSYVKLMWVLGHTREPEHVRDMMLRDYVGEISARSLITDGETGF